MTLYATSRVEISAYSAVGQRRRHGDDARRWRGIGGGGVVCNGRALSGSQTERRRARRPNAPYVATVVVAADVAATRQPPQPPPMCPTKKKNFKSYTLAVFTVVQKPRTLIIWQYERYTEHGNRPREPRGPSRRFGCRGMIQFKKKFARAVFAVRSIFPT